MWEAHHSLGRLTKPNDAASDMKERVCSKSSSEVCTCWDIVTFSTRKSTSNLHELLNGFHHLWIQSTNFRPSGPAVPSGRLPLLWEKSGQGGAYEHERVFLALRPKGLDDPCRVGCERVALLHYLRVSRLHDLLARGV